MAHIYSVVTASLALLFSLGAYAQTCDTAQPFSVSSQYLSVSASLKFSSAGAACGALNGKVYGGVTISGIYAGSYTNTNGSLSGDAHSCSTSASPGGNPSYNGVWGSWMQCAPDPPPPPPPPDNNATCASLADSLNFVKTPLVHFGSVGLTACFGGFVIAGTGGVSGGGQSELYGPFKCSGAAATPCSVVPKPAAASPIVCPPGSFPGTVNGVEFCAPPTNIITAPEKTTVSPPAAGSPAPTIADSPPGTATSEKSTSCVGPDCTTTTTFRDAAGAPLGQKVETKPTSSFCSENPTFTACKEAVESTFSGSCTGVSSCTGDAIQCAIAAEAKKANCEMFEKTGAQVDRYVAAVAADKNKVEPSVVNISASSFDQSNALGVGASCVTDKTISFGPSGHTFTASLPLSRVCEYLGWIGYLNLAVAFILAARIVGRG